MIKEGDLMAAKKYKRKTNAEKKMDKEIRQELREKGILPPIKPKLNRKKFAKEVREEWDKNGDALYLRAALGAMVPSEHSKNISSEQIGVLKLMKISMEYKKFDEEKKAQGETKYSIGELYEKVMAPILNL